MHAAGKMALAELLGAGSFAASSQCDDVRGCEEHEAQQSLHLSSVLFSLLPREAGLYVFFIKPPEQADTELGFE